MSGDAQTGVQGQRIAGRFELCQRLGSGGYGSVWRGHDRHAPPDRSSRVALKLIRAHRRGEKMVVERFEREAHALQRLIHPNTVRLLEFGPCSEGHYLVMELLEGESLGGRLLREHPLVAREVHALGMGVLHSLAEAHMLGIVHRDIKPDNLFLCVDGSIKVLDWGLVKTLEDSGDQAGAVTEQGIVVGSLAFMAPERMVGSAATAAGDIYALGCTLFAALTGRPPFSTSVGKSFLARAHQHTEIPRPTLDGVAVVGPLVDAIGHMMAKSPSERPSTVDALVNLAGLRPPLISVDSAASEADGEPLNGTVMLLDPMEPTHELETLMLQSNSS